MLHVIPQALTHIWLNSHVFPTSYLHRSGLKKRKEGRVSSTEGASGPQALGGKQVPRDPGAGTGMRMAHGE